MAIFFIHIFVCVSKSVSMIFSMAWNGERLNETEWCVRGLNAAWFAISFIFGHFVYDHIWVDFSIRDLFRFYVMLSAVGQYNIIKKKTVEQYKSIYTNKQIIIIRLSLAVPLQQHNGIKFQGAIDLSNDIDWDLNQAWRTRYWCLPIWAKPADAEACSLRYNELGPRHVAPTQ